MRQINIGFSLIPVVIVNIRRSSPSPHAVVFINMSPFAILSYVLHRKKDTRIIPQFFNRFSRGIYDGYDFFYTVNIETKPYQPLTYRSGLSQCEKKIFKKYGGE